MKLRIVLSAFAMLAIAGCGRSHTDDFTPIGNGFGYVTHVSGFTDRSLSEGLCYQDSTGKRTRIWPYLQMVWGDNIQVTNNIAVLVGGVSHVYAEDGVERLSDRLIAFEAPAGPPMDITDQVLQKYCADSGVKRADVIQDSLVSLTKTNSALRIDFGILKLDEVLNSTAHDATIIISWRDIEAIIQDVKKSGKSKKEKRSGTEYLQKE